jgi:hypothetical protein
MSPPDNFPANTPSAPSYPPGLVPDAEETYDCIRHDGWMAIYTQGKQDSEMIQSDSVVSIER